MQPISTGTGSAPSDLEMEVAGLRATQPRQTYLLYSMSLWLRTLDTQTLEVENLVDGPDDKKVDFFHLDRETRVATIAQGYESADWSRADPPGNKASDLNAALSWLLEARLDDIPRPSIRAAAEQLRDALTDGSVRQVDALFVHNLAASKAVDDELATVERLLNALLAKYATADSQPSGRAIQWSADSVDAHRRALHQAIAVTDELTITSMTPLVELAGLEWRAVVGTVSAKRLVEWEAAYGDDLFNANVRDYLGSRETARNINHQIQQTALSAPDNFWIFNNGITILTNTFRVTNQELALGGVSIINGAQTTGSLRDASKSGDISTAAVPFRAIECRSRELVEQIIKYNNLQNPVAAWDRRSIDPLQIRLQQEFERLGVTYQLRRGEGRRKATDIHFDKLAPYLTAFYGEPIAAANKSEVFESEPRYRAAFRTETDVRHYLFVYRLGEAVSAAKLELRAEVDKGGSGGDLAEETYKYFRYGTFSHVVVTTAARVLGTWLEKLDSEYRIKVTLASDPTVNLAEWDRLLRTLVVDVVLPAMKAYLRGVPDAELFSKLKSATDARDVAEAARALVEQVEGMKPGTYSEITDQLVLT